MASDKFRPHLVVLPEDDANRQIVNGFILKVPALNQRVIQVLQPAGGWTRVLEKLRNHHASAMQKYPHRRMLLMLDFDHQQEERLRRIKNEIPSQIIDRTFILGVLSEPETLKARMGGNFEDIGQALAQDCTDNTWTVWEHTLLKHNKSELDRIISSIKPFLFG